MLRVLPLAMLGLCPVAYSSVLGTGALQASSTWQEEQMEYGAQADYQFSLEEVRHNASLSSILDLQKVEDQDLQYQGRINGQYTLNSLNRSASWLTLFNLQNNSDGLSGLLEEEVDSRVVATGPNLLFRFDSNAQGVLDLKVATTETEGSATRDHASAAFRWTRQWSQSRSGGFLIRESCHDFSDDALEDFCRTDLTLNWNISRAGTEIGLEFGGTTVNDSTDDDIAALYSVRLQKQFSPLLVVSANVSQQNSDLVQAMTDPQNATLQSNLSQTSEYQDNTSFGLDAVYTLTEWQLSASWQYQSAETLTEQTSATEVSSLQAVHQIRSPYCSPCALYLSGQHRNRWEQEQFIDSQITLQTRLDFGLSNNVTGEINSTWQQNEALEEPETLAVELSIRYRANEWNIR